MDAATDGGRGFGHGQQHLDEHELEAGPDEKQHEEPHPSSPTDAQAQALEYKTPPAVKFAWLGTYFFFSMLLTLYNKFVLGKYPFPWLLTFLHTSFASVGTFLLMKCGYFKLSRLGRKEHLILAAYSVLFTTNIAASNLSLSLVNIAFFQIMRTTVPIFTIMIYRIWFSRSYSTSTYQSLVPIIVGAGLTTINEYRFTDAGFLITLLGVILAAVKTVTTNRLMTGPLSLPSIELLMRMSPLAAIQSLIYAAMSGEVSAFAHRVVDAPQPDQVDVTTLPSILSLIGNGLLAFCLNISSFQTNKLAGALTMSVCGNLKQVLTVALGILAFGDFKVDVWNCTGVVVTMVGAALYSKAELDARRSRQGYAPVQST